MKDLTKRCQKAIEKLNAGKLEEYLTLYAPNASFVGFPPEIPATLEGAHQYYSIFLNAFPDIKVTFQDAIEEDNKLAIRYTWQGTHKGEFMGAPPTKKTIKGDGFTILHFKNGLCTKRWIYTDVMQVMQQLGMTPAMSN